MLLKIILGIWLAIIIFAALALPIVPQPTAWYELPYVPGLGEKARIIFFHVPMAWVAVIAFIIAMIYAIRFLQTKNLEDDLKSSSSAGLGFLFCILATLTGSLWAKFSWGSFWNWDPRQTSIFVLLLIYGSYFALRSATDGIQRRATLSSVYAIIAGLTSPFFIFILPRLAGSLHPDPIINVEGKIHMNTTMLILFLASLIGFTALYLWIMQLRIRTARLESKQTFF